MQKLETDQAVWDLSRMREEKQSSAEEAPVYLAVGDAIVRRNGNRFHNRPLYGANGPSITLAGDLPHILHLHEPMVNGAFMAAYSSGESAKWLQDFDEILTRFRPNHVQWELQDAAFPGLYLLLEAVPLPGASGFAVHLQARGGSPRDTFYWAHGGVARPDLRGLPLAAWALDPAASMNARVIKESFAPDHCRNNQVHIEQTEAIIAAAEGGDGAAKARRVRIACSAASKRRAVDAAQWAAPLALWESAGETAPMLMGALEQGAVAGQDVYWVVQTVEEDAAPREPEAAFAAGLAAAHAAPGQVQVDTPDNELNMAVAFANAALDGLWYPPVYVHGGMMWNVPFPGWRSIYGPTAFGWHTRVREEAAHYCASQVETSDKNAPKADPDKRLTIQHEDSRFHGEGRIAQDQQFYNFQEVFFDQLIHAWRWTGNAELVKLLRPALERHLAWQRDCFDADDDGLYESYINVWGSDNVWYAGAATAQATAYAYTGHVAAAELAEADGDHYTAEVYHRKVEKIRRALQEKLWMPRRGQLAQSREARWPYRLRDDADLYTVNLPIDAGLLSMEQAAQMLHYTEWALERNAIGDGEMCWQSNWVPYAWSVREREPADNLHLALSCYSTGLSDAAWRLIRGCMTDSIYSGVVPGAFSSQHGVDFADAVSMFARVVVEGLFGYRPDYPNDAVVLAPLLPDEWDRAAITTPDYRLRFERERGHDLYDFEITKPARLQLRIPIRAGLVHDVLLDGAPVEWEALPAYGHALLLIDLPHTRQGSLQVNWQHPLPEMPTEARKAVSGERIRLKGHGGKTLMLRDPQHALSEVAYESGVVAGRVTEEPGFYLLFLLVDPGLGHGGPRSRSLEHWQLIKLHVENPVREAAEKRRYLAEAPEDAAWRHVPLDAYLNGDVRAIHKQEYLSPRPHTCSVQIATDGHRGWCDLAWGKQAPEPDLSMVEERLKDGTLTTGVGAAFQWPQGAQNAVLVSRWDNWPDQVTIDAGGAAGHALWALIAGSTNHMQTRLANGVLRVRYADGLQDELELVPPYNYLAFTNAYDHPRDAFALPEPRPARVQLGKHCWANVVNLRLRPASPVAAVTLEALSEEVVIGLMGLSIMEEK